MNSNEKSVRNLSVKRSVFVSHASKNFKVADELRALLEAQGISCWIAPRDIPPGGQYGTTIVEAIRDCTIVVLLLTDEANKSKPVENEIERAFNHQKTIVPIRLREITPSKGLEFFVSNAQWVDAIVSPLKGRIDQIVNIVHAIELDKPILPPEPEVPTLLGRVERKLEQALRHKVLSVSVAFAVLLLLVAGGLGMQVANQEGLQTATTSIGKSADRIDGAANTLEQTSGAIKGMDAKLDGVKKETSEDPRKELANMGLAWSEEVFFDSLGDQKAALLYKQAGMKLHVSNFYRAGPLNEQAYQFLDRNLDVIEPNCVDIAKNETAVFAFTMTQLVDNRIIKLIDKVCNKNMAFVKMLEAQVAILDKEASKIANSHTGSYGLETNGTYMAKKTVVDQYQSVIAKFR